MTKIKLAICLAASALIFEARAVTAQTDLTPKSASSPALPTPAPTLSLSATLSENLKRQTNISRENREQAYAKLLEGQRYFWSSIRRRSNAASAGYILAGRSFQKAVELDPNLAEGYIALAELALITLPRNVDESVALANLAVKIQPDSFGARRILAFGYTIKSGLNHPANLDAAAAEKAIAQWKQVARLAPRFAEAWAFLSEFYDRTNRNNERIEALKRWRSSASPVDTYYYRWVMGAQESLAPDSTSLKLGAALIKANRASEAVEVLSLALSVDSENIDAVDLLKQAVESGNGKTSPATLQALRQAVFANPNNAALIELLADVLARGGETDEAAKFLRVSIANFEKSDKNSAASLQVSLGDIYAGANRYDEAVAAYEAALKIQGIDKEQINTEEERGFAMQVLEKIIQVHKNDGKFDEAKIVVERARILLGKEDLFADKQIISLLRETGRKQEALQLVRRLRAGNKSDYSLMRLEASLLTDSGKVEEGVRLIETLLTKPAIPSPYYDDFINYIFISNLYNQAKRGNDAVEAAHQALAVAESVEKQQIANLSLATAQQTAGNYQSAENILRNLLKKSPGNPVALNNLGYFLLERNKKFDEALSLIRQAVDIDPTNSLYLDSLGWAYFKLENFSEAELYLKEAARRDAASAAVFEHLGDVYQRQEKFDLAKSAWQRAVNITSNTETENRLKGKMTSRAVK